MNTIKKTQILLFTALLLLITHVSKSQTNFIYGKQFGSDNDGVAFTSVTDQNGNVYIAGEVKGAIKDQSFGGQDGFISKFDSIGNMIWTKQIGTSQEDKLHWLAIDKSGNLYATGYTKGDLEKKNLGKEDILVVKVNGSGTVEWQKQFGTDSTDVGSQIYIDELANIYVSGASKGLMGKEAKGNNDCVLMKLDTNGNPIWTKQFGTEKGDICSGITGDESSNIYVCGNTRGNLAASNMGQIDAFAGKFTINGEQVKLLQFGTSNWDAANCITIDKAKNIYVGGSTAGNLGGKHQGQGDGFLTKINSNWEIIWTQQFGTDKWDGALGVAINEQVSDKIFVSGCQNWPSCQSYIRIYNKDGSLFASNNRIAKGKNGGTCGKGVCIDNDGNIYHTGNTGGSLFQNFNKEKGHDIFLLKLSIDDIH